MVGKTVKVLGSKEQSKKGCGKSYTLHFSEAVIGENHQSLVIHITSDMNHYTAHGENSLNDHLILVLWLLSIIYHSNYS